MKYTYMWSVPKLWDGRTVAVLASGPSMSAEVVGLVRQAGIPAIAVNNTFRLAPWADMLYAADHQWWAENPDASLFKGLKVSVGQFKGVHQLHNTGTMGFDPDPSCLRTGGNSGYQAVHIAMHAGAKRILLLGFNMEGAHWHADYDAPLRNTTAETFPKWIKRFESIVPAAKERGVEIVNCTSRSVLDCFRTADLGDVLALEVTDAKVQAAASMLKGCEREACPVDDKVRRMLGAAAAA